MMTAPVNCQHTQREDGVCTGCGRKMPTPEPMVTQPHVHAGGVGRYHNATPLPEVLLHLADSHGITFDPEAPQLALQVMTHHLRSHGQSQYATREQLTPKPTAIDATPSHSHGGQTSTMFNDRATRQELVDHLSEDHGIDIPSNTRGLKPLAQQLHRKAHAAMPDHRHEPRWWSSDELESHLRNSHGRPPHHSNTHPENRAEHLRLHGMTTPTITPPPNYEETPLLTTMTAAGPGTTVRVPEGQIAVLLTPDLWARARPILANLAMTEQKFPSVLNPQDLPDAHAERSTPPTDTIKRSMQDPTAVLAPQSPRRPLQSPSIPRPTPEHPYCPRCTTGALWGSDRARGWHQPRFCLWRPSGSSQSQWPPAPAAT